MDRNLRRKTALDPVYGNALNRVFSKTKQLTDDELLARLRSLGLGVDRPSLESLCSQALSVEEVAEGLLEQRASPIPNKDLEIVWSCLATLWLRWFPDKPSFEMLDDKMQAGYELLKVSNSVDACRIWLDAWKDVVHFLDRTGIQTIEEFDERFQGTQFVSNWIQDLESELWNAGLEDRHFLKARIDLCEEGLSRFGSDDALTTENRRRSLAESYFELGELSKAEALYHDWLKADSRWGWGWIGWSDFYRFTHTEHKDLNRAEQILREGISIPEVRDWPDIADRLADLGEQQGRSEEAAELRRQAKAAAASTKTMPAPSRDAMESSDLHFTKPLVSSGPPPAAKQKIGRNDPCPCGSGKKYKKCCGG
jgi:tetratricopeptide (TPR) repeat protein